MAAGAPAARLAFQADLESALQLAGQANTSKHRSAQASTFGHWITFCHEQGVTSTLTEHLGNLELRHGCLLVCAVRCRREGRKDKPVVADAVAKALAAIGQASTFGHWITFCHKQGVTSTLTEHMGNPELRHSCLLVCAMRYRREGRKDKPVVADTVAKALTAIGQGIARLGQPDPRFDLRTAQLHSLHTDFLSKLREDDDPPSHACPVNVAIIRSLHDVIDTKHAAHGQLNAHVIDLIIVAFCWPL